MTQRLFSIVCTDDKLARDPAVIEWLEAVERQMNDGIEAAFQDFAVFGVSTIEVKKGDRMNLTTDPRTQ